VVVDEFELLAALRSRLDGDGPGLPRGVEDDAAVIDLDGRVVAAVDTLVDGVHIDRRWSTADDVGFKALSVNVSDLAAMGAVPVAALISLQRPSELPLGDIERLYDGMREAADRWGCRLVGGDTVTSPVLAVSVTVLGRLVDDRVILRRDAAKPGHLVVLVGELGLAAAGLGALPRGDRELLEEHPELGEAHRRPVALVEAAAPLVVAGAQAAIDVSDGLGRDLGHVATASGVGIRLDAGRLPRAPGVVAAAERLGVDVEDLVVGGGEDQALAVTIEPRRLGRLDAALETVGLRARVVGEVIEGSGVELDGRDVATMGWEHR
jgi:thiamine-monophosphate kinase